MSKGRPSHTHVKKKRKAAQSPNETAIPDSDIDDNEVRGHAKFWSKKSKNGFLESLSNTVLDEKRPKKPRSNQDEDLPQRLPVKDQSGRLRPSRMAECDRNRVNDQQKLSQDRSLEVESESEEQIVDHFRVMSEVEARNRIAELSSAATASPELELKTSLDQLAKFVNTSNHQSIRQLALLSQATLFIDLCPSYPIHHHEEKNVQLTKQVKATRRYEMTLLSGYLRLLEQLFGLSKRVQKRSTNDISSRNCWAMGFIAVRALCHLLSHLPHFNHSKLIIKVLVPLVNHPFSEKIRELTMKSLSELVSKPAHCDHAVEVVSLICKIVVDDNHEIQPSLIRLLFFLPLQHRPVPLKKSNSNVQIDADLKRDLQAAEAVQSLAKVNRTQRVLLEKVFRIYFTILRSSPSSVLLPTVLEGLSKFAHLVNVDLLLDLLTLLDQLMSNPDLPLRSILNCIVAAFRMLLAQGSAVVIDARGFYARLYNEIDNLAWVENHHLIGTFLVTLDLMFIKRRQVSVDRVGAFILKLANLAINLPGVSSQACLHTMYHILARYPTCSRLLDNDNCGSNTLLHSNDDIDPDQVKPFSTCMWQLSLLERSYDQTLCKYSRIISQQQTLPIDQLGLTSTQLLRSNPTAFFSK